MFKALVQAFSRVLTAFRSEAENSRRSFSGAILRVHRLSSTFQRYSNYPRSIQIICCRSRAIRSADCRLRMGEKGRRGALTQFERRGRVPHTPEGTESISFEISSANERSACVSVEGQTSAKAHLRFPRPAHGQALSSSLPYLSSTPIFHLVTLSQLPINPTSSDGASGSFAPSSPFSPFGAKLCMVCTTSWMSERQWSNATRACATVRAWKSLCGRRERSAMSREA